MRETFGQLSVVHAQDPAISTTTVTSDAIDLQGYRSLTVLVSLGATGDTLSGSIYWTLKLCHSDDDAAYDDCTAAELSNGAATIVVNANTLDQTTYKLGYRGNRRYVKAVVTPTGTHSNGTPIGILGIRGHAANMPVA